ncbi:MAG: uncharacterized membrane protein YhaH (DUF805 family) [Paracoccaceae bacterium]|jgi:uncharacterized membrane protein YhaH (DUF805 family)
MDAIPAFGYSPTKRAFPRSMGLIDMGFSKAIRTCLRKYINFSGRASRSEYWYFFLFIVLANLIAGAIDWQMFTSVTTITTDTTTSITAQSNNPVQGLIGLAVFLPHLAVAWRRMHDSGRSGFYALLPMLLMAGAAAVLVFGVGIADLFAGGGRFDILFTRLTLLTIIPTMLILMFSPLLVLWWLTRQSLPGTNSYGPNPQEVTP